MSKRVHKRYVRRLETEFSAEGKEYRAISSDFSCGGLFIRTNHPFRPGTILDIRVHLPDGNTSVLEGRVCRAIRTPVVSLKNGMGVELTKSDSHYSKFMLDFTTDCTDQINAPTQKVHPLPPQQPEEKTAARPQTTAQEEYAIIACGACGVKNKVHHTKFDQGPKCGKCGAKLLPG